MSLKSIYSRIICKLLKPLIIKQNEIFIETMNHIQKKMIEEYHIPHRLEIQNNKVYIHSLYLELIQELHRLFNMEISEIQNNHANIQGMYLELIQELHRLFNLDTKEVQSIHSNTIQELHRLQTESITEMQDLSRDIIGEIEWANQLGIDEKRLNEITENEILRIYEGLEKITFSSLEEKILFVKLESAIFVNKLKKG